MASILLIYPSPQKNKKSRFGFSLNLLYVGAILKNEGHTIINYLDFSLQNYSYDELNFNISKSDYIIIELDSFSLKRSSNAANAELMIKNIKKSFPSKIIIAFGYDLLLFPRKIDFANFSITSDILENNISKIVNKNNINYNYNKDKNSFDKLPFPARFLLSSFIEHGGNNSNLAKSTLIETSRGCLNSCAFCQRKGWQKKFIAHSVDYVISEFEYLQKRDYKNIWITDSNFTFDLNRSKKILQHLIINNLTQKIKLSCSSWTKIDKELLKLAKSANISIMSFGIESANYEILNFYKKNINLKRTKNLITYADKTGLYTIGNFIIGAPIETEQTIENTFKYALETPFDQINIKILDYMAGAKLFDGLPADVKKNKRHLFACKENGLNKFKLSELIRVVNEFKKKFNKSRKKKLYYKIKSVGMPYNLRNK